MLRGGGEDAAATPTAKVATMVERPRFSILCRNRLLLVIPPTYLKGISNSSQACKSKKKKTCITVPTLLYSIVLAL